MHKGCTWNHIVIEVAFPPPKAPKPLALFICKPLNNKEHAISLPKFHKDFLDNGYTASNPTNSETPTHMFCAKGIYKIHQLTKCYRLHNNITYILAHLPNFLLLDWSISTKHNEHMCAFLGTPSSPSTVWLKEAWQSTPLLSECRRNYSQSSECKRHFGQPHHIYIYFLFTTSHSLVQTWFKIFAHILVLSSGHCPFKT